MKKLTVLTIVLALTVAANAYVLNWDSYNSDDGAVGLVPGTATWNYYNVDGSGIDVRVDWVDAANMEPGYPTNDLDGLTGVIDSAHWFVNDVPGRTVAIVSFSEPVPYCKVDFWEVDGEMTEMPSLTNYMDRVRLKGWDTPYDVSGAVYIAPSDYDGGSDIYLELVDPGVDPANSGLNIINGGGNDVFGITMDNWGTATFEDASFQAFAFEFKTNVGMNNRGALLGDIVFVPEPATLMLLGIGAVLGLKRR